MSGDGGFTMMLGEFVTLIQTGLPVKVFVLNNGTLGFVEMEMKASGFLDTGCDLKNPNFAAMANAMGIKGVRVEHPAELEGALREAFAHPGPALVDVVSARQELVMPPTTTAHPWNALQPDESPAPARPWQAGVSLAPAGLLA